MTSTVAYFNLFEIYLNEAKFLKPKFKLSQMNLNLILLRKCSVKLKRLKYDNLL